MTPVVGRFAPSPTGPLHFGSLLAAVASWLDVRTRDGHWWLRIEDLDPPREMAGAADRILRQVEAFGLEWDGSVLWQHTRHEAYQAAITQLQAEGQVFWCRCSRADLARHGGLLYPGTCRTHDHWRHDAAVRLRVPAGELTWSDGVFGPQTEDVAAQVGDFVIQRRDGLYAYQLAVVVDDAFQGVTEVVRGADLLDNTGRQIALQQLLGLPRLRYSHLPLAVNERGEKLSKQTYAPPLPESADLAGPVLSLALAALGHPVPAALEGAPPAEQLAWARATWQLDQVPRQQTLTHDPRYTALGASSKMR